MSEDRQATSCKRRPDQEPWWACDYCGSMWTEAMAGVGWRPLSCPDRRRQDYKPEPGEFDRDFAERIGTKR